MIVLTLLYLGIAVFSAFVGMDATGLSRPAHALPPGEVTLSHSFTTNFTQIGISFCENGVSNVNYLRKFVLSDYGIGGAFDVSQVTFGVKTFGTDVPATINLYVLTNPAGPFAYANMTQIGTKAITINTVDAELLSESVTGTAPPGSTLIIEVSLAHNDAPNFAFVSNTDGQSDVPYIARPTCDDGPAEPTGFDVFGASFFASHHWIAEVTGVESDPSCPTVAGNIIQNYCFEDGPGPWQFFTNGQGNYLTSSGDPYQGAFAGRVNIVQQGTNVQLYQAGLSLEPNSEYELSFAGRSSIGANVAVYLHQHGAPYKNYGLANWRPNLTGNWGVHSTTFTTGGFGSPVGDGRLRFWMAPFDQNNMSYDIDWVVLRKTGPGVPPIPTNPPLVPPQGQCQPAPGNLIANPGFESGAASWSYWPGSAGTFGVATADPYECAQNAIINVNQAAGDMQLYKKNIPLQPGQDYRLRLAARANSGENVRLYMHKHGAPYTNYGLNGLTLDLTPAWQQFVIDFRANGQAGNDARLRLYLGPFAQNGSVYEFDDIVLTPLTGGTNSAQAAAEQSVALTAAAGRRWQPADNYLVSGYFLDGDEAGRIEGGYVDDNGQELCQRALPSHAELLPADGRLVNVRLLRLGNPHRVRIDGVWQDEAVGEGPDATIVNGSQVQLRAERDTEGDGRVYHVAFTAGRGRQICSHEVVVTVPPARGAAAIDSGWRLDALHATQ